MNRKLNSEERALWDRVAQSARPMKIVKKINLETPKVKPKKENAFTLRPFEVGSKTSASKVALSNQNPPNMDARKYKHMRRGRLAPVARIDLHGMTVDQAHPALINFIVTSQARGLRLVLVITGKGKPSQVYDPIPTQRGILRQSAPRWMAMPPLRDIILETTPAHQKHGGEGAFYVYLRRNK